VLADETQQGAVLNGDGDMDDGVWHFVEPHLGTIQSLDLSSADTFGSSASGDLLALVVQEIDGVDRNGDSDFGDSFVALLEPALAQQSEAFLQSPFTPLVFAGERVAFLLNEVFIGDRNGDNDFQDDIVHTLEASAGAPTSLDLDALSLQAAGERLVFERSEDDDDQVGDDWNGDGDHDDRVLFAWDPLTGLATSTNLASTGGVVAASSAALLLVGSELGQHQDLNGDGDQNDLAWVLHELASGTNVNLGGAALVSPAGLLEDGRGLVLVFEGFQGRDLNGDRDVADLVLHTFVAP
jgi:hypothetical protein